MNKLYINILLFSTLFLLLINIIRYKNKETFINTKLELSPINIIKKYIYESGDEGDSGDISTINLNKIFMCPACPGESIDQSQNPFADNMREIVKQKVREGLTDDEIKQYFVDRYGVRVLLEPPVRNNTLVLWIVPPIGISILAIILISIMKMKRRISDNIEIDDSSIE